MKDFRRSAVPVAQRILKQGISMATFLMVLLVSLSSTLAQEAATEKAAVKASPAKKEARFKHTKQPSVVYSKTDDYELKCDLYIPESETPRPAFVMIHGGAWTTGSKIAMLRHARILANRGYVVMSIDYRLAPDHKWPAQIHDCKHAVRWIRHHAEKYNADPNQVYTFGYSAGGHLALLLATTDADDGLEGDVQSPYDQYSSRVDGCIAGGAPCEFSWIKEDARTLGHWMGNVKSAIPEEYLKASPTHWITPDDPVAILFHGNQDALVPSSSPTAFHKKCQQEGVLTDLIISENGHLSTFMKTSRFLDSFGQFKSRLTEQQSRRQKSFLQQQVAAFSTKHSRAPNNPTELEQFMKDTNASFEHPQPTAVASIFVDPLTDEAFPISWGSTEDSR